MLHSKCSINSCTIEIELNKKVEDRLFIFFGHIEFAVLFNCSSRQWSGVHVAGRRGLGVNVNRGVPRMRRGLRTESWKIQLLGSGRVRRVEEENH